jgi:hypothetical protein
LAAPYTPPAYVPYVGPTPADPFALAGLDIFEALEQAELHAPNPARPEAAAPQMEVFAEAQAGEPLSPVVKPVLIGSGEGTVVERKKGWWRR